MAELEPLDVAAVLDGSARPLKAAEEVPVGAIVGLAPGEDIRMPVWLCEVLGRCGADYRVFVKCMMGEAAAAVWYGPPTWDREYTDRAFAINDVAPCNYDVYGVLPRGCQGPPVTVERCYVRAFRVRLWVPPPYRRGGCYHTESAIAGR